MGSDITLSTFLLSNYTEVVHDVALDFESCCSTDMTEIKRYLHWLPTAIFTRALIVAAIDWSFVDSD